MGFPWYGRAFADRREAAKWYTAFFLKPNISINLDFTTSERAKIISKTGDGSCSPFFQGILSTEIQYQTQNEKSLQKMQTSYWNHRIYERLSHVTIPVLDPEETRAALFLRSLIYLEDARWMLSLFLCLCYQREMLTTLTSLSLVPYIRCTGSMKFIYLLPPLALIHSAWWTSGSTFSDVLKRCSGAHQPIIHSFLIATRSQPFLAHNHVSNFTLPLNTRAARYRLQQLDLQRSFRLSNGATTTLERDTIQNHNSRRGPETLEDEIRIDKVSWWTRGRETWLWCTLSWCSTSCHVLERSV